MNRSPAHLPQYEDVQRRIETYHNWPVSGLLPHELAESGFVYRGDESKTVCFQCGVPLREWRSHDDADIEHARFSPECLFIRQKRGTGFVKTILEMYELPLPASLEERALPMESAATGYTRSEWNSNTGNTNQRQQQQLETRRETPIVRLTPQPRPRTENTTRRRRAVGTVEPRQIRARLDTDWGKLLLQQGFPRELVGQVFGERLQMEGDDFPTFSALLNAVLAASDILGITVPIGGATNVQPPAPPPAENPYFQWEMNQGTLGEQNPGTTEQNLDISIEDPATKSAVELNKDLKRKLFCRRCLTREADILFMCCNRRVSCEECAFDVTSCLVCGALEQERIKVFAA
jgi:hypothetical protein